MERKEHMINTKQDQAMLRSLMPEKKKERIRKIKQYETVLNYLKPVVNGIVVAGNYALVAAIILLVIWLLGRVMEALNSNTVFDPVLTFWLGASVSLLLFIKIIGFGIASWKKMAQAQRRWPVIISWVFFIAIIFLILFDLEGFSISSSGLLAAISGSVDGMRQASFLMFKYYPANPMLTVNLLVSKLKGVADIESLVSYTWNLSYIFAFFIWSFVYSILLLLHKSRTGSKIIHLFFSTACLSVLILLKSTSNVTDEQLVFLHSTAVTLLIFQVLLTYSVFRTFAGHVEENEEEKTSYRLYSGVKEPERGQKTPGLPPSAISIAFCIFIVLPVLLDLQSQFDLAPSSSEIVGGLRNNQEQNDSSYRIATTRVSVYAGPSIDDEILGFLPEGIYVPVREQKSGWVKIGENRWVSEKFLRPDITSKAASKK